MFYLKYFLLFLFASKSRLFREYKLYRLLNKERKAVGLWNLFYQKDLRDVGRKHSGDMAKNDYFAHDNLSGLSPKDRFVNSKVSEAIAGENLAKVRGYKNPVIISHVGLMNSPGHKANILSKSYNCVGIGMAKSENGTYYFTQNFSYRYLILKEYPSVVRFLKKIKIKGKIINNDLDSIMLRVKDQHDEILYKKIFKVEASKKFKFIYEFPKNGRYKFEIFVHLSTGQGFKLANHFKIKKTFIL